MSNLEKINELLYGGTFMLGSTRTTPIRENPHLVPDCNYCINISVPEYKQTDKKEPHMCEVYGVRCLHRSNSSDAKYIHPCSECVTDNYSRYLPTE